jgi:Flp pilus assembly protein TadG
MATMRMTSGVLRAFRLFGSDSRGLAGIDFALTALLLALGLLNAVDAGYYAYRRMEVENAADAGAQAAWKLCSDQSSMLPATQNCSGLTTTITSAIHGTSLAAAVSLASGSPTEGYYCVNSSNNTLQFVSGPSSRPSSCGPAGTASAPPADYLQQVTHPYQSLFPGLSVMGALGITSITKTSWMRMG